MVIFTLRSCDAIKAIVRPVENGVREPQSGAVAN